METKITAIGMKQLEIIELSSDEEDEVPTQSQSREKQTDSERKRIDEIGNTGSSDSDSTNYSERDFELLSPSPQDTAPAPEGHNSDPTATAGSGIILTLEKTQCSFCYVDLNPGDGLMLQSCLHNFCRDCVLQAIEQSEAAQIQCPEEGCGNFLLDSEVKALLNPEAYQNFLMRSFKVAQKDSSDLVQCKSPQCGAMFSISQDGTEFNCAVCGQVNCLKCKALKDHCTCRKRASDTKRDSEPAEKMAKIDPELKKDWDSNWSQIYESVSNAQQQPQASTSTSDGTLQDLLNKMEHNDLLKATREFNCSICLSLVPPGDGIILKECFHMFCKTCLSGCIEHCEDPKVKCPFVLNDYSCTEYISERECKALVSPEIFEKLLRRSVTQAEMTSANSFHCKTVNCQCWVEFEDGADSFACPICLKKNCIKCRAIHESLSCLEYQAKLEENEMDVKTKNMLANLVQKGKAMKCPTCKIMIEKTSGCDGMQCSVCKTDICWATKGPRWGPRGKGDNSGGCGCRVKGKMCHPKCKGCH